MARKSMKEAATASTSVFDTIANGGAKDVKNVQNVKDVKNVKSVMNVRNTKAVKNVKATKTTKNEIAMDRLNLKIPTEIRNYLDVAAARETMKGHGKVSLTEYLCDLVRADMKKHKDD